MVHAILRLAMLTGMLALAIPAGAQEIDSLPPPARPALRPAASVIGEIVRIGDLVANAGAVADVAIFRAPDLGETGSVPTASVLEAIRPHHLLGLNTQNITEVAVTRVARSIPSKEIEAQIARYFAAQFVLGRPEDIAITFDRELRTVNVEPSVTGDLRIARAAYDQRSMHFDVVFELPGGASRAPLRFTGKLYAAVAVAILERPLARGETIKESDVLIERRPKTEFANDTAPVQGVIGMAARQPLRAGQAIRRGDVMKPELVQRNDTVTILYEVPGITLTMRGKAMDAGAEGDIISVQNLQSQRTIQGTVAGAGLVTIAASVPAEAPVSTALPVPAVPTTAPAALQPPTASRRPSE
jgi:flagellar basal body P-ring formation protein FlgA